MRSYRTRIADLIDAHTRASGRSDPVLRDAMRAYRREGRLMDEVFGAGGAPGCAFVRVTRENFPEPRSLFGARSPVLTARRMSFHAGVTDGDDVIRGEEVVSFLLTDESFAGAIFGGGPTASPMTLDRLRGVPLPQYRDDWEARLLERLSRGMRSEERMGHLLEARSALADAAGKGKIGKVTAADIGRTLQIQTHNFFLDAEHRAMSAVESVQKTSFSRRMSMAGAVIHHDAILEARRALLLEGPAPHQDPADLDLLGILRGDTAPGQREALARVCAEVIAEHLGENAPVILSREHERLRIVSDPETPAILKEAIYFRSGRETRDPVPGDPREFVIDTHHPSGHENLHTDLPANGRLMSMEIGTVSRREDDMGDRFHLDRSVMKVMATAQEMILAIEAGPVGMASRCTLTRVNGCGPLSGAFPGFWKGMEERGVRSTFTSDMPERRAATDAMAEAATILTSGPNLSGIRKALDLVDRGILALEAARPEIDSRGRAEVFRAADLLHDDMMRSVARSDILERWENLQLAIGNGRDPEPQ